MLVMMNTDQLHVDNRTHAHVIMTILMMMMMMWLLVWTQMTAAGDNTGEIHVCM